MVKGIILGLSLLPLIGLSLLLYFKDDSSKLGIITSVSVVLMDFFSFLIYHSDMVDSPIIVVILLIVNRVMMVALGSAYFIYGYMLLYIMYSSAFVYNIAKNRFPFEGEVVLKAASLRNLAETAGDNSKKTKVMTEEEKSEYWKMKL
jgi:hypothetical protein